MGVVDVRVPQARPLEAKAAFGAGKAPNVLGSKGVLERREQDLDGAGLVGTLERFERERDRNSLGLFVPLTR
jgi:hypothetical protein